MGASSRERSGRRARPVRWRVAGFFWLGTLLSGLLLVVCIVFMPESVMFLQKKPDAASQENTGRSPGACTSRRSRPAPSGRPARRGTAARPPVPRADAVPVDRLHLPHRGVLLHRLVDPQLISNASGDKGAAPSPSHGQRRHDGGCAALRVPGTAPACGVPVLGVGRDRHGRARRVRARPAGILRPGHGGRDERRPVRRLSAYAGASGTVYPAAGRASGYGTMLGWGGSAPSSRRSSVATSSRWSPQRRISGADPDGAGGRARCCCGGPCAWRTTPTSGGER
ncbi:hypothetical protein HBB16_09710 [Pseudonocardia sp. MCCB 268]|nr:hypothetical protein [Pseudonocardia cytotoxica]